MNDGITRFHSLCKAFRIKNMPAEYADPVVQDLTGLRRIANQGVNRMTPLSQGMTQRYTNESGRSGDKYVHDPLLLISNFISG